VSSFSRQRTHSSGKCTGCVALQIHRTRPPLTDAHMPHFIPCSAIRYPGIIGSLGVILEVPQHPNTWFRVEIEGKTYTLRPSALELVEDDRPVRTRTGAMLNTVFNCKCISCSASAAISSSFCFSCQCQLQLCSCWVCCSVA
jgi:hypothetical protein